jgi:hypothetical protein
MKRTIQKIIMEINEKDQHSNAYSNPRSKINFGAIKFFLSFTLPEGLQNKATRLVPGRHPSEEGRRSTP